MTLKANSLDVFYRFIQVTYLIINNREVILDLLKIIKITIKGTSHEDYLTRCSGSW